MNFGKHELIISFFTGGAIMAVEIMAADMFDPKFGSSIYSWSAILGFTMFGLASGYILGGVLSKRENPSYKLLTILLLIAVLTFLLPSTFDFFARLTQKIELKSSIAITSLFIVFPTLLLLGMCSPLIIRIVNQKVELAGQSSGIVFAISTLGGITFTLMTGLFIIPYYGLLFSINLLSAIVFLCFVYYLIILKKSAAKASTN